MPSIPGTHYPSPAHAPHPSPISHRSGRLQVGLSSNAAMGSGDKIVVVSAPKHVPVDVTEPVRLYRSPPRRDRAWIADRPGDRTGPTVSGPERGARLGSTGPDQGYAFGLVSHLEGELHLGSVKRDDAVAGCVAVAMKRSALFGRAPVIHDVRAAFTIWGFLDADPAQDMIDARSKLFAEVRSHHHYSERRDLVDLVPDAVLRQDPKTIAANYAKDWKSNFSSEIS